VNPLPGAYVRFGTRAGKIVHAKIGTSFVSVEQEIPGLRGMPRTIMTSFF
jgi:hypothetical protein